MTEHMTPTERLYELGLALANRQGSEPVTHCGLERLERYTKITLDVADTDPKKATDTASKLFDLLCAKYPRENGTP